MKPRTGLDGPSVKTGGRESHPSLGVDVADPPIFFETGSVGEKAGSGHSIRKAHQIPHG
jgi:hypothetical protein